MSIYTGKRVFVTGGCGFKGRALVTELERLGAHSIIYDIVMSLQDDVRNFDRLRKRLQETRPDIVFHLAAQAFVSVGYEQPKLTWETNVNGTLNVLESLRVIDRPCALVVVTSDKIYGATSKPATEATPLVGHCPYSASKTAAEMAVEAYRDGFFLPQQDIAVATARAGNVIGGGDWGVGRLIPNAVRALRAGKPIQAWNPSAVRPWQFISDVISGYLRLGERLMIGSRGDRWQYATAWNFGPDQSRTVREVIERVIKEWGSGTWKDCRATTTLREVSELRIDSSEARTRLGWRPRWSFERAVRETIEWYKCASIEIRP